MMNREKFLGEGEKVVTLVREGLKKRNINAGEPILTTFQTDDYNARGDKLFWISVKTVTGHIRHLQKILI